MNNLNNIAWLDGNNAEGKFILEINFAYGGKGYLKSDEAGINNHYEFFWSMDEIVGMTVYNPARKIVRSKFKEIASVAA